MFETDCDVAPGSAINIGEPIEATDSDNDPLTYSLEGPDARYFTIDRNRGQIKTKPGVIYDFESRLTYTVTVKVSDGRANDTIEVTINVKDLLEVPCAPRAPNVRLAKGGETGLSVSWKAPRNTSRSPITGYDLQYRTGPDAAWLDGPQDVAGTSTTITMIENFDEELPYEVQVRAQNDEGDGPWSKPGRLGTGIEGDAVQTSWIVRFARTVGSQVFDSVTGRLNGGSGTHVSLGGMRTDAAAYSDTAAFGTGPGRETAGWRATERNKKQLNLLPGSSFQLSVGGEQGDPTTTAWGRIGTARFDAKKKPVALFGDVLTTVVGADVEQDRWLGGIAVSVSNGAGVFELAGDDVAGEASGRLTNVYGYTRFRESEKIDVWGILGYGAGELKILQEDEPVLATDLGMRMVATGLRGELPSPDWGFGYRPCSQGRCDVGTIRILRRRRSRSRSGRGDAAPAHHGGVPRRHAQGRDAVAQRGNRPAPRRRRRGYRRGAANRRRLPICDSGLHHRRFGARHRCAWREGLRRVGRVGLYSDRSGHSGSRVVTDRCTGLGRG